MSNREWPSEGVLIQRVAYSRLICCKAKEVEGLNWGGMAARARLMEATSFTLRAGGLMKQNMSAFSSLFLLCKESTTSFHLLWCPTSYICSAHMPALLAALRYRSCVDPCFSACPANIAKEERVQFQDGDLLLLAPLKAALWKRVPIKIKDFRRSVLEAVLFYPTHSFSSWKCNVSVSRL